MSIDKLVLDLMHKEEEVNKIAGQINGSAQKIAILFIDLSDSTKLKEISDLKSWLVYIYKFINIVSQYVTKNKGTVIKRIGDELMLSFNSPEDVENFLDELYSDKEFVNHFKFKIAIDYGVVYYFKFEKFAKDDPYGTVVDRCARIAKLCKESVILCSSDYVQQIKDKSKYVFLSEFSFKGISSPQKVYISNINLTQKVQEYFGEVIKELNNNKMRDDGYRYVSRTFTPSDFQLKDDEIAKPFLIHELLKVPRLPYSLQEFVKMLKSIKNDNDYDKLYGYMVEWEGYWISYTKHNNSCLSFIVDRPEHSGTLITLYLPSYMNEILASISKWEKVKVRGVLVGVKSPTLNFVDFAIYSGNGDSKCLTTVEKAPPHADLIPPAPTLSRFLQFWGKKN